MSEAAAPRRRSLFRKPDFARLWTAATVSLFGTQVTQIAIPFIAAVVLGASPGEVGLLVTVDFLPFLLFTLPAGVWVDRFSRKRILVIADIGRAIMLSSIPIAYALGVLTIGQLYLVGFVNGVFTVFFDVADQSYLPTVLERDELVDGNSKLQISQSAAMILGQPFGGGVIALFTAPIAIAVDALSFVASALLIFTIRRPEVSQDATSGAAAVEAIAAAEPAGGGVTVATEAAVARGTRGRQARHANRDHERAPLHRREQVPAEHRSDDRDREPLQQHRLRDVRGLRLPRAGPVAAVRRPDRRDRRSRRVDRGPDREPGRRSASALAGRSSGRIVIGGIAGLLVPLAPVGGALPYLAVAFFVSSITNVVYNVNQVSLRQAITPQRFLGRMNATMRFLVWGTIPIGSLIGAGLSEIIGVRSTVWVGSLLGLLPFLFVFFSPVRSLAKIPDTDPDTDADAGSDSGAVAASAA